MRRFLQLLDDLVFDQQAFLLQFFQLIVAATGGLKLQYLLVGTVVLVEQRIQVVVARPALLNVFLGESQVLIQVVFHWHGVPPQVDQ